MANSSILDLQEFKQYRAAFRSRVQTLTHRASYYDGSVYSKVRNQLGWLSPRVFKEIKPLFLPLNRAVDVDCGIVPGGWEISEEEPKKEQWEQARDFLFDQSHWDTEGVLYVHYGAQYGVSGLFIADIREESRVILQPVDPTKFMLIGARYGVNAEMSIYIEYRSGVEYAEVTTADEIRTFIDGKSAGHDDRPPIYANSLGMVPYVEVRHMETGEVLGECTFQKAMIILDEVNRLGTQLAGAISKNTDPQWAIMGAEPGELTNNGEYVWFFPAGTDAKVLVPGIDIDGILSFIQTIADNVDKALPETAFDELKSKDRIATATIELQLAELVLKIKRVRPNYDRGLVSALQMAGIAGKQMNISELAPLDDLELTLDRDREILPMDPETRIKLRLLELELEQLELAAMDPPEVEEEADDDADVDDDKGKNKKDEEEEWS